VEKMVEKIISARETREHPQPQGKRKQLQLDVIKTQHAVEKQKVEKNISVRNQDTSLVGHIQTPETCYRPYMVGEISRTSYPRILLQAAAAAD
jgi:hypothetical protein